MYFWTNDDCSIRVKVNVDGMITVVHHPTDSKNKVSYLSDDNENWFKVYWNKGDFPRATNNCEGCQLLPGDSCLCNTLVSKNYMFREAPTSIAEVLDKLYIGAVDPSIFDLGTYVSTVDATTGITTHLTNDEFNSMTVFEFMDDKGRRHLVKNSKETVQIRSLADNAYTGYSFRNTPQFMSFIPSENTKRDAQYETEATLDHYFYHDNTAPFIASRLIQRLVSSNPTPRYVKTVSTAFKDGQYISNGLTFGTGKYGDMAALFAAIYLDREARSVIVDADPSHGSLREPILKVMSVLRSMEFVSTYPVIRLLGMRSDIGQMAHAFESVFSFFLPEFKPYGRVGDATLVAPEGTVLDMPRIVGLMNGLTSLVRFGLSNCNQGFGAVGCKVYTRSTHGILEYNRTAADVTFSYETFEGPSLKGGLDNEWVGRRFGDFLGETVEDPVVSGNHVFQPTHNGNGYFFSPIATRLGNTIVKFQYYAEADRSGGCIGYSASENVDYQTWVYCDFPGYGQNDMLSTGSWITCQFEIPSELSGFRIVIGDRRSSSVTYFDNVQVTSGTGTNCGVTPPTLDPPGQDGFSDAVIDNLATLLTAGRLSDKNKAIIRDEYDNAGSSNDGMKIAQQLILTTAEFHTTNPIESKDQPREGVAFPPPSPKPYKAVVYLMLSGGCDSYNMLVPHTCTKDKDMYAEYLDVRQQVAIMKQDLLPIDAEGQICERFGVHPDLTDIQRLYNSEDLLFFANTGVLTQPVDKSNYNVLTETQLFAHNHMQREAKRVDPYSVASGTGVLGRMADYLAKNGHNVGSFSVDRYSVALVGKPGVSAAPMIVNRNGVPSVYLKDRTRELLPNLHNRTESDSGFFAETWSEELIRSLGINDLLSAELSQVTTNIEFPTDYLSSQLATVSRLIATRNARGVDTDTFYVEMGGYDTHSNVEENLSNRFTQLNQALGAFNRELEAMSMWNNVTLVQTSDFARTLEPNSGLGTDHAWGGNYIMMGGAVKGGQILGKYPDGLTIESTLALGRGRMIPSSPWDGVFRGIANWLGVPTIAMTDVFPNLNNFDEDILFDPNDMFGEVAPNPPTASPTTASPSKPPTNSPTAKIEPTATPSFKPTVITDPPTRSPTSAPTKKGDDSTSAPTVKPTDKPTFKVFCADDATYKFEGTATKGCDWVKKKPGKRCVKRDSTKEGRLIFEFCKKSCGKCSCKNEDWFYLKPKRDCDWVAKRTDPRCSRTGAKSNCRGACSRPCCKDDPEWMLNGNAKRDCSWFTINRCNKFPDAQIFCPSQCGKCPA